MSFLKFQGQSEGNGRGNIYWGRAGRDNAPFRGPGAPIMREEEFDEHAEKVWDSKFGTFDTSNPGDKHFGRTYQEVLDGIMADWFRPLCERQFLEGTNEEGRPIVYVYVEWGEPYLELPPDKARTLATGVHTIEGENRYDQAIRSAQGHPRTLRPTQDGDSFVR